MFRAAKKMVDIAAGNRYNISIMESQKRTGKIYGCFKSPMTSAFAINRNGAIYVDKSGLMAYTNKYLNPPQIHRQKYPEKLAANQGNLLLCGINYDKEGANGKKHTCVIEQLTL